MDSLLDSSRLADIAGHEQVFERPPARRSIDEIGPQDFTVEFDVEGTRYSLAQMLADNADDEAFCAWARAAKPGEFFPGVIACQCIAAGDLSEADLVAIDKAFEVRKSADPFRDREAYDATHAQNQRQQQQGRLA
jgi:hypothetical protein